MPGANGIYRLLLKLYPARFREEYETPLELQFQDEYRETRGPWAQSVFWLRALRDLAISIPAEGIRELRQDLRYALRVHRRSPFPTGLAFTALALAIGAATGIFSVLNALLLRSLPFRDPGRLVQVQDWPAGEQQARAAFYDWRRRAPYLTDAVAYASAPVGFNVGMNLSVAEASSRVQVAETSANFFSMLGAEMELGRAFAAEEDVKGRDNVAVISYALWQELFGDDLRVLGTTIRLGRMPLTVVGVAQPRFDYPNQTEVWTPTVFDRLGSGFQAEVVGRVKPGITLAQAGRMMEVEAQRVQPKQRLRPQLVPLREVLAGPVRKASLILMGTVAFALLIACANVAQLLLSRVTERRHELMVRTALGASRARLVQQLTTESMALTLGAAALGLVVARWAAQLASAAQPAALATQNYTILDWRVLGFGVAVAILTGLVFGVLPASLIGRMQPAHDLIRSQPGAHGSGVSRMRATLIASQTALAVVLLAGSVSLGRSFLKVLGLDWGFRADRVVTLNVSMETTSHAGEGPARQYHRDALERLRAIPGVESAGAVNLLPLTFGKSLSAGVRLQPSQKINGVAVITASSDYFRTIGSRVIDGREFADSDRPDSEPVAVVNEAFGREFGDGGRLVGRKIWVSWGKRECTIVGVVRTGEVAGVYQTRVIREGPRVYLPLEQRPTSWVTYVVKVRGKPEAYLALCRDAVQRIDRQVPVYGVNTFNHLFSNALARSRFYTTAILFFGAFALLLAVIGIYGVAAHSIQQRTQEIGVRIAVGASPSRLRFVLLRQSLLPVAIGMAVGVAGAIGLGRFLQHLMTSAEPVNAWTSTAAAVVLALAAAVAIWSASARILRIDPSAALRAE